MHDSQTSIKTQVSKLDQGIGDFARCVADLHEELFLTKLGSWSPRDILAHLIGWNRYIIKGSKQIKRGELPFYDIDPGKDYSKVNAVLVREYSASEKQKLLDELKASAQELKLFLYTLDSGDWAFDFGVRNLGACVTIQNTIDDLIADYVYHRKQIEAWAKQQVAQSP